VDKLVSVPANAMPNRVLEQFCIGRDLQLEHQLVLLNTHGLGASAKLSGDFDQTQPIDEPVQDRSLTRRKHFGLGLIVRDTLEQQQISDKRIHETTARAHLSNGSQQIIGTSVFRSVTRGTSCHRPMGQWRIAMHGQRQMSKAQDPGPLDLSIFEGTRELRVLADGFEHMRQGLQQRDTERQAMLQQLTNTLECISDGFLTLDTTWHITYVNAQAEKLLRRQRRDLLGSNCWSILSDQEAQPLRLASEQALLTCLATRLAVCLPSLDLHLEVSIYPSNQGLTYYCRDISELDRAQVAQTAQLAAEAANQAKSEFLSRMSHELRTPLHSVLGFAQILRINPQEPLSPPQAEMVKNIESAGQHLLAVISDVLDAQALKALITLQLDLDTPPGEIRADRTRLKQILLNLLSNAIKYNRPQGTTTLAIHRNPGKACFSVCDTGIGLSKAQLNQLFQPFNRLGREHSNVPGSGIGLVISRRLVSAMGSSLQVSSQEGRGSTFSFSLPLAGMANADH
jgi:signal transduction histidine kinase